MTLVGSDLRSSAALVIAALISTKVSHIYGLEHLDRGYENFEFKLSQLGAQITREARIMSTTSHQDCAENKLTKKDLPIINVASLEVKRKQRL